MRSKPLYMFAYFILILILLFNTQNLPVFCLFNYQQKNLQCYELPYAECKTSAKAMCVLEQNSGRVLFGKNINLKLPMASTTKIFTALTVLERCKNLDAYVNVNEKAVGIKGTSIYLRKGERLTVKELLYGMMLPSGNDAATALGYYIGKDIPSFCKMMEAAARKAGAVNSCFKNPHGLDEEGHYTTAYDLAIASASVMKYDAFKEIVTTKSTQIRGNKEVKTRYLRSKNKLLSNFSGCTGIKTGFTNNAGRCFVGAASRENLDVVCSVLNCGPMFEECAKFMELAFKDYKNYEIIPAYNIIDNLNVIKGRELSVKVFSRKSFEFPLTSEEFMKINYEYKIPDFLTAPIKKEQKVGTIKVYLEDKLLFQDEVLTKDNVIANTFMQSIRDFVKSW